MVCRVRAAQLLGQFVGFGAGDVCVPFDFISTRAPMELDEAEKLREMRARGLSALPVFTRHHACFAAKRLILILRELQHPLLHG